jgi:hypothetical protein
MHHPDIVLIVILLRLMFYPSLPASLLMPQVHKRKAL